MCRLHGIRLIGPAGEEIWYFAYGANMKTAPFAIGAACVPPEWRPGRVRGYRLRFNLMAPRGKATYANLCADPGTEIWGVLYKITRRDLVRVEATEGVPWGGYRPHWLDVEDLGGAVLQAVNLMLKAMTTTAPPRFDTSHCCEGARAHGPPEHYIRFLEQAEHAR